MLQNTSFDIQDKNFFKKWCLLLTYSMHNYIHESTCAIYSCHKFLPNGRSAATSQAASLAIDPSGSSANKSCSKKENPMRNMCLSEDRHSFLREPKVARERFCLPWHTSIPFASDPKNLNFHGTLKQRKTCAKCLPNIATRQGMAGIAHGIVQQILRHTQLAYRNWIWAAILTFELLQPWKNKEGLKPQKTNMPGKQVWLFHYLSITNTKRLCSEKKTFLKTKVVSQNQGWHELEANSS